VYLCVYKYYRFDLVTVQDYFREKVHG